MHRWLRRLDLLVARRSPRAAFAPENLCARMRVDGPLNLALDDITFTPSQS